MSGSGDSNPLANIAIGLLIGVGASFLYIRFGIEMPSAIGVGQRITSEAIVKTAELELFNNSNSLLVRHRALAMILANKPDVFLEVDQAIGHRFLTEFLRQHRSDDMWSESAASAPLETKPVTINRSKVRTTVINAGTIIGSPVIGVAKSSNLIAEAMLRQKYPEATDEVIRFLLTHPETRSTKTPFDRQANLPGSLLIDSPQQSR